MRGSDETSGSLFSYVDLESRIPRGHVLRTIRAIVNDVLANLSVEFEILYSSTGRPGIPPERLLRATLLQAFYAIRSERQLMEQLDFNLLFRWFVGLGIDESVWDATVFCKNRDRLLEADVARKLLSGVVTHPKVRRLLSQDHFSVDGSLIEAWASVKSFRPKENSGDDSGGAGRNAERNFRGEVWSNETHASTTDSDARLYRKSNGQEAKLCFMGHVLMENRNGLVVDGERTVLPNFAKSTPFRTSLRTPTTPARPSGAPPSTDEPLATQATPRANEPANGSKRCSAGLKPPPGYGKPNSEDWRRCDLNSLSPSPPTT